MSDVPAATQAIPLSKKSDEYTRIAYMLQLALRSNDVEDVRVWKVENPHLAVQFQKRTAGMLVLDAWVDATSLGEQNAATVDAVERSHRARLAELRRKTAHIDGLWGVGASANVTTTAGAAVN